MNGEELEARCVKLFGKKHWKKTLAEKSGKDFTTIRRWRRDGRPPGYVDILLEAIEAKQKLDRITTTLTRQLR